jgi:CelD/BcsL family acetyltransferase involved in cellulose biosynthesis
MAGSARHPGWSDPAVRRSGAGNDAAAWAAEPGPLPAPGGTGSDRLSVTRVPPARWPGLDDWDAVLADSARPSVFLTRDWVTSWWDSFGQGAQSWLLRVAGPTGATLGLAPLYLSRPPGTARLPIRRLGLIGDHSVGSEYLGLVARAGHERVVGEAVADHLAAARVGWDVAELSGLVEGDPAASALEVPLRTIAGRAREQRQACSAVMLPDSFEAYLGGLGSKFRQSYRQRASKLHRTCTVRYLMTASEADLPPHLEALFRMHQAHWISLGLPGSFGDPRMRRFYLDVARRLLRSGRLRFWQLEVDGVIRASQFGFAYNGVLHSLQEGYDAAFRAPGVGGLGVVLRAHAIRSAIGEGLAAYDFLGGTEEFKRRWGTSTSHVRLVRLAAPGARGALAWLATVGAQEARSGLRGRAPERLVRVVRAARARRYRHRAAGGP